jgi:hypothetical protein
MLKLVTTENPPEELAHRAGDGVEVALLWSRNDERLTVEVFDSKSDESFVLDAAKHEALDVFYHPFAYAALRGVEPHTAESDYLLAA